MNRQDAPRLAGLNTDATFKNAAAVLTASLRSGTGIDSALEKVLRESFDDAGADEGTLWLLDAGRENLVAVFNSGANADRIAGRFQQPLTAGVISLVCATEMPICENEVYRNRRQDPTLDRRLGLLTCSMIAVPLYVAEELGGIVSCVRLKSAGSETPDPPGFTLQGLRTIQHGAEVAGRLIDECARRTAAGA